MLKALSQLSLSRHQSPLHSRRSFSVLSSLYSTPYRRATTPTTCQLESSIHIGEPRLCHTEVGEPPNALNYSKLFKPAPVRTFVSDVNIGQELVGPLNKTKVKVQIQKFYNDPQMRATALDNGLDATLFYQAFVSFRKLLENPEHNMDTDLHVILYELCNGMDHVHSLFPYFMVHARKVFPHLLCLKDLCKISDLTSPVNWYPDARAMKRKIVFHAGPTNSGKTYHAMKSLLQAESGMYCGPLKLLATEVFTKANSQGTPCDLVTGEERSFGRADNEPSAHTACTVEMANLGVLFDVAVIDEIQQIKDSQRGWAWTRALLGVQAREVHVCGEAAALPLVQALAEQCGEEVEVHTYARLTGLTVEDKALGYLSNVQPGDCFVCFNRISIQAISGAIRRQGHEVAIIYGAMPPTVKLKEASNFNDPENPCKVMVATDAIGMGLNLSIRRVIFASLYKPMVNEKGEKELGLISVSQALQIAGRSGRYGTQWEHGYVTTLKDEELPILHQLLASTPDPVMQAGLHPTAEQIELFAYHMPHCTMSNLVDLFQNLCTMGDMHFMCQLDTFKHLADLIQDEDVPLRARYVFCCAPIAEKRTFLCATFVKMVRQYAMNVPCSTHWLCHAVSWPFREPAKMSELQHLEEVFDCFDLYLWLSYRFPDMFPEQEAVRAVQCEMDEMFMKSVKLIAAASTSKGPAKWGSKKMAVSKSTPVNVEAKHAIVQSPSRAETRMASQTKKSEKWNTSHDSSPREDSQGDKSQRSKKQKRVQAPDNSRPISLQDDFSALGGGRMAQRLVSKGLISPSMLRELQQELKKNAAGSQPKPKRKRKSKHDYN